MIKSFADEETERIFARDVSTVLPRDIQQVAIRKLRYLDAAEELRDLMSPPANRLEALEGDRKGQYSIRVNDRWRVCFRWENGNAYDVEIIDYH